MSSTLVDMPRRFSAGSDNAVGVNASKKCATKQTLYIPTLASSSLHLSSRQLFRKLSIATLRITSLAMEIKSCRWVSVSQKALKLAASRAK